MAVVPASRRTPAHAHAHSHVHAHVHRPAHAPAQKPPKPDLRVVDERDHGRRLGIGAITTLVIGAVFTVLFGLVVFHTILVQNQQRLDKLDEGVRTEQARYQQLRLQVAQLEAPQRIVDVATQKLGMVPPDTTTYLTPSADDAAAAATSASSGPQAGDANDLTTPQDGPSQWPQVKPYLGATP